MTAVTAKVEINFSGSTWTDVTAYWDAKSPISLTGGRSGGSGSPQPGRMSGLRLNNTDGRFTDENPSGPYFGYLIAGRKVRISVQDPGGSTYYVRFVGKVDGWPLEWADNGQTCWCVLSATDMLSSLSEIRAPLETHYGLDNFTRYWPMTDHVGSHHDPLGGATAYRMQAINVAYAGYTPPSEPGPPANPALVPGRQRLSMYAMGWTAPVNLTSVLMDSWCAGVLFKASQYDPNTSDTYDYLKVSDGVDSVSARLTTSGYLRLRAGGATYGSGTVNICNGEWWWITLGCDGTSNNYTYVKADRIADGGATTTSASVSGLTDAQTLTDTTLRSISVGMMPIHGAIGHASWDELAYPINDIAIWTGFPADTVAGFASEMSSYMLGPTLVDRTVHGNQWRLLVRGLSTTWLEAWTAIAEGMGGIVYADRAGTLAVMDYARRFSTLAGEVPVASFDSTEIGPDVRVEAIRTNVVNRVSVTALEWDASVGTVMLEDTYSRSAYGTKAKTITSPVKFGGTTATGEVAVSDVAQAEMRPVPLPELPSISLDVLTLSVAQQQAILSGGYSGGAIDIWDVIAVTLPDTGALASTTRLGRIEGWSEAIGLDTWALTWDLSHVPNALDHTTMARLDTMRLA